MIQLPRRQYRKHIVLVVVILAVITATGFGAYILFKHHTTPIADDKQLSTPPTFPRPTDRLAVEPHDTDPGARQEGVEGTETSDESAGAAAFPTTQPNLVVEITDVKQVGNRFEAATVITPKASGSCTVELTRPGNLPLIKTSPLVTANNTTSCKDTAVDITQAARGEWTLTVKVQVGNNVATATESAALK